MAKLHAFNCGANVLAIKKNDTNYALTIAWSMLVDTNKCLMLVNDKSVTGKILEVGDIVGVSALAKGHENVALNIGTGHSTDKNKLANVKHYEEGTALLVANARTEMVCKVIEFVKSDNINPESKLVLLEILSAKEHAEKEFLYGYFMG